jgi:hypothetical protein
MWPMKERDEDRFVRVRDVRARYWQAGESGSTVLLLAGVGSSVLEWEKNIGALAQRHKVRNEWSQALCSRAARKMRASSFADKTGPQLFNVSKILPFIRRAISVAGSGFWHSDSGLSQKLELGNISNRLRAAAPRQVSGSLT